MIYALVVRPSRRRYEHPRIQVPDSKVSQPTMLITNGRHVIILSWWPGSQRLMKWILTPGYPPSNSFYFDTYITLVYITLYLQWKRKLKGDVVIRLYTFNITANTLLTDLRFAKSKRRLYLLQIMSSVIWAITRQSCYYNRINDLRKIINFLK